MENHKKTSEMEVGLSHKLTSLRLLNMLPGLTLLTLLPPLTLLTHTAYTVAKILRYIAKWLKRYYNMTVWLYTF